MSRISFMLSASFLLLLGQHSAAIAQDSEGEAKAKLKDIQKKLADLEKKTAQLIELEKELRVSRVQLDVLREREFALRSAVERRVTEKDKAKEKEFYNKIEVKGRLQSTGQGTWSVAAEGFTWHLYLGKKKAWIELAKNSPGQVVVVTGWIDVQPEPGRKGIPTSRFQAAPSANGGFFVFTPTLVVSEFKVVD